MCFLSLPITPLLTWLGPLCNLDLELISVGQVVCRHPKAAACNLKEEGRGEGKLMSGSQVLGRSIKSMGAVHIIHLALVCGAKDARQGRTGRMLLLFRMSILLSGNGNTDS